MFTVKKLNTHIDNFLSELKNENFHIHQAILFGSYANGNVHENSDIDIAIWADEFEPHQDNTGMLKSLLSKYYPINPIFYNSVENDDPFMETIFKTGKKLI